VARELGTMSTKHMVRTYNLLRNPTGAEVEPAQCPAQDCGGDKAFFYMVQIRSADEPMTTFYKVNGWLSRSSVTFLKADVPDSARSVAQDGKRTKPWSTP
jgi:Transcription factor S-II (TFIIS)